MAMSPRLLRPRAPGGYTFRALRQGLVAYWPMNETATSGDVLVNDETGRGNHLASINSVLSVAGQSGNGREFTAANSEWLASSAANNDLKFADGRDWTIAGWIYVPTWTTGTFFVANDSTSNREIVFDLRATSGNNLACNLNPGGAGGATVIAGSSMALNSWHFWSFTYTHSTGVLSARVNNGAGNNAASSTRGAGSLVQSTQPLNLGRRQFTGANAHFGGRLDEVAKWDRVLSAVELDTLWNNGNGINLAAPRASSIAFPTATNADAQAWINNVYANGGTVSTATANAVNTFCTSIESAGLRDRFYRLNLFAGTGLSAALVPLFRGPSLGGTQFGNATDTNVGPFVSGDYAETGASGGLTADSNSKYLQTGLNLNAMDAFTTGHFMAAIGGYPGATQYPIGAVDGSDRYLLQFRTDRAFWGSNIATSPASNNLISDNAMALITRESATALTIYNNSTAVGTNNGSTTPVGGNAAVHVFRSNLSVASFAAYVGRLRAYSIGRAMTSTQVASLYTAMQSLQTSLGRTQA